MGRSKASTARYHEAQRQAREQAEQSAASIIRDTIAALPDDVLLTTTEASYSAIDDIQQQIAARGPAYVESLPAWVRNPCPAWFTRKTVGENGATLYVRDTERWNKEQRAAQKAILQGDYEPRTRKDGSAERYIPMPCNAARLVALIRAGNAQAVIEGAPQVVKSASVKKNGIIHDLYVETGVIDDVDHLAHKIVMTAADLSAADRAFKRAESDYFSLMGQTVIRNGKPIGDAERLQRKDGAKTKLDAARAVFVKAWEARNRITIAPEAAPIVQTTEEVTA